MNRYFAAGKEVSVEEHISIMCGLGCKAIVTTNAGLPYAEISDSFTLTEEGLNLSDPVLVEVLSALELDLANTYIVIHYPDSDATPDPLASRTMSYVYGYW